MVTGSLRRANPRHMDAVLYHPSISPRLQASLPQTQRRSRKGEHGTGGLEILGSRNILWPVSMEQGGLPRLEILGGSLGSEAHKFLPGNQGRRPGLCDGGDGKDLPRYLRPLDPLERGPAPGAADLALPTPHRKLLHTRDLQSPAR